MSHRRDVTTTSEAAYESYREGVANETRFYFKEARLAYAKALELDPSFAMAMLGLARQSKDNDQRLALLRRASKEKDRLTERERLHVEMALAMNEKRRDDAMKIAAEIHQKFPTDVRSAQMLAGHEFAFGRTDKGIKIFEELLTNDPNNADAYNQIGYFYGYRGRLRQSRRSLQALSVHRPGHREPLRLARRGAGLLGALQRGPREPQPRARDQARFRRVRRAYRRGPRGHGRVSRGDQAVRARRRDDGPSGHAARVHHAGSRAPPTI